MMLVKRLSLYLALAATKSAIATTRISFFGRLTLAGFSSVSTFVVSTTNTSGYHRQHRLSPFAFLAPQSQQPLTSTTSLSMSSGVVGSLGLAGADGTGSDMMISWRSRLEVSIAKTRKIRGSNYVQIATVDPQNNEPRVRTVVFRGFLSTLPDDNSLAKISGTCGDLPCLLKMCTDARSQKVSEHSYQSTAELVWWFPKTSEQYRIRGRLILIGGDEAGSDNDIKNNDMLKTDKDRRALMIARKELWGNLSDPARESFLDPLVPGSSYVCEDPSMETRKNIPEGGRDEDGKVIPPPSNFLLMLLDPYYVDYLNLSGAQYRQIDKKQQLQKTETVEWSQQRVNP